MGLGAYADGAWFDLASLTGGPFLLVVPPAAARPGAAGGARQPDNYYWGTMIAPLAAMGLPFAPRALHGLVRAALAPGVGRW